MVDLFSFFSNFLQLQIDDINRNILAITSPGYTYLFLSIFIYIYRRLNKMI